MKNNYKKLLLGLILLLPSMSGCSAKQGTIVLEEDFVDTFEYTGKALYLPSAHFENTKGKTISYDISYSVYTKSDNKLVKEREYSSFLLDVGEYNAVYKCESQTLTKAFKVVDTTAPVITFSKVPSSLYIQDIANKKEVPLPSVKFTDLSLIDNDSRVDNLTFNGNQVKINTFLQTYEVTTYGTFNYVVSVKDIYGNAATNEVSWKIKDKEFQPIEIEKGLLADFSSEGYTNYVTSCDLNEFSDVSSFSDSYLESYKNANGVVKVNIGFKNNSFTGNNSSITIKLPEASHFTYEDLKGKYIAARVLIENNTETTSIKPYVAIYGNISENTAGGKKALNLDRTVNIGEWTTIYLDAYNAARLGLFDESSHDNGEEATFPGGDKTYFNTISGTCESISFAFYDESNRTSANMNFYIDSIAIANKVLETPNVVIDRNQYVWNEVTDALKYEVNFNGNITEINDNHIDIPTGKGYAKIKAITDHITSVDSSECIRLYGVDTGDYIANFNDELYTHLINQNLTFNRVDEFENQNYRYKSGTFKIGEGLECNLSSSNWGIVNGMSLKLPTAINSSDFSSIIIRMKVNNTAFNTMSIYDDAGAGKGSPISTVDLKSKSANEYFDVKIDLYGISRIINQFDFIFGIGASLSSFKINFAYILGVKNLADPDVQVTSDKLFTWNKVEHVSKYLISVDGHEDIYETTESTFQYPYDDTSIVRITMIPDSIAYIEKTIAYCFENSSWHQAKVVDLSNASRHWSRADLIQIKNVNLEIPGVKGEVTDFNFDNVVAWKYKTNGKIYKSDVIYQMHYHANVSPTIFQLHFDTLSAGETITIFKDNSFFKWNENDTYYVFNKDINLYLDDNGAIDLR